MNASLLDYIKSGSLYALPHHAISRVVYKLTRIETPLAVPVIKLFSKAFNVDLNEAVRSDPAAYRSFNAFFTREIKPALRPVSQAAMVCPVDGTVSQSGKIKQGRIFQAKGQDYTVQELLACDAATAEHFANGQFVTIYLSPRDYHRIHMPFQGQLTEQVHIPGRLFSVAPHTVKTVSRIFARNERVVAHFDTDYGRMAMVLVGAINVAAIETVWDGLVTPPKGKAVSRKSYRDSGISLKKGEEMGRFNMGSTIVMLLEADSPAVSRSFVEGLPVKMGQSMTDES
ncbi:MAG: phosphatidylserine decarboxylase [Proteobacteria bacterium]|nr:MAG: phosphatidylserine decarboxylase [Pseudomonadota bacterium]